MTNSHTDSQIVAVDFADEHPQPRSYQDVHRLGLCHRAVHIEVRQANLWLVFKRCDGRLEIPGGHVDWRLDENRAEDYREAALREICEELNLTANWQIASSECIERLQPQLAPLCKTVNQYPSTQGINNEHVVVFQLDWQVPWGNPIHFQTGEEGNTDPQWLDLPGLIERVVSQQTGINAALRGLLARHQVILPIHTLP